MLSARHGHFRLESGHHGDLWLDLDLLFLRPAHLAPFVEALTRKLSAHPIDAVCGPLTGGAFVAQEIALALDLEFSYSERFADLTGRPPRGVGYRIPDSLRARVRGRNVAIVDDVINAGSAVLGTLTDLLSLGAKPVVIGSLLVLGDSASILASDLGITLESVGHLASNLWAPSECPLCASGVPLEVAGAQPGARTR